MVPVRLGDGISEPLMGDLVGDGALAHPPGGDAAFRVEDGRRVLHAAEAGGGLYVGQLLEGEGAHQFGEEVHHLVSTPEELGGEVRVLGEHPEAHVHTAVRALRGGGQAA